MIPHSDLPRIPIDTYSDYHARKWSDIGALAGMAASIAGSLTLGISGFPAFLLVGAAVIGTSFIGQTIGNKVDTHEIANGRAVQEPSFWNSGIIQGITQGLSIAGLVIIAAATGSTLFEGTFTDIFESIRSTGGAIAAGAFSTLTGVIGGFVRKHDQQEELSLALDIQKQQGLGQARTHAIAAGHSRGHAQEHNGRGQTQVSAQEVALLEARMKEGGAANFIEMLQQQQAAQAAAEPQKA